MNNNDVLRRLRYTFELDDSTVIKLFGLAAHEVTRTEISDWLKSDEDPEMKTLNDTEMAAFLNGFIVSKRGKKNGKTPEPEKKMNNNIILTKLKIALNLQSEEILALLTLAGLPISKHELSAFFRKNSHKHYRSCKDQILRNFIKGLQMKYREGAELPEMEASAKPAAKAQPKKAASNSEPKKPSTFRWGQLPSDDSWYQEPPKAI